MNETKMTQIGADWLYYVKTQPEVDLPELRYQMLKEGVPNNEVRYIMKVRWLIDVC